MKPEIASILIKFGKKEVSLTPDEARDLHDQLNKLFGTPAPVSTIWITQQPWTYQHGVVLCGGDTVTDYTLGIQAGHQNTCSALVARN